MGFWDKSLLIFKYFCDHGKQSVRRIAQQTGLSKSSVHRLSQAMERRGSERELKDGGSTMRRSARL